MKKLILATLTAAFTVSATGCVVTTRPVARPVVVRPAHHVVVVR